MHTFIDEGYKHPNHKYQWYKDRPEKNFNLIAQVHKLAYDISSFHNREADENSCFERTGRDSEGNDKFNDCDDEKYARCLPKFGDFGFIRRDYVHYYFF